MKKLSSPVGRGRVVRATIAVVWRKSCRDLVAVQAFAAASPAAAWRPE